MGRSDKSGLEPDTECGLSNSVFGFLVEGEGRKDWPELARLKSALPEKISKAENAADADALREAYKKATRERSLLNSKSLAGRFDVIRLKSRRHCAHP